MNASAPLPEDLAAIEALRSELSSLETWTAKAAERAAQLRATRDESARDVMRLEPVGTVGNVAIPAALAAGILAGIAAMSWWVSLPLSRHWPRLSAAISLGVSSVVLLRGAWRSGRVSGARGPR
ncbi:MAG: hypothetical protein Q8L48_04705 [Archangium sp.]|nr:hypothetical protein [Archangium sp.]